MILQVEKQGKQDYNVTYNNVEGMTHDVGPVCTPLPRPKRAQSPLKRIGIDNVYAAAAAVVQRPVLTRSHKSRHAVYIPYKRVMYVLHCPITSVLESNIFFKTAIHLDVMA